MLFQPCLSPFHCRITFTLSKTTTHHSFGASSALIASNQSQLTKAGVESWVWGASTRDKVSIRVSRASATSSVFFVFGKPPDLCEAIACLESSVERHGSPDLRPVVVFNTDKPFPARTLARSLLAGATPLHTP